jgi:hypothetical protein
MSEKKPAQLYAAPPSWGRHPKTFTISDIARRLRSASSLFRQEQLAGENIDEVHLSDDDKPVDWNRRAACLPTLTSLQLLLRAAVADDAEPTRLPISGVGATGT